MVKRIVGVAIKLDNQVHSLPKPYRHHHILHFLYGLGYETNSKGQGFILEDGTFVDRKQAFEIACNNGQLENCEIIGSVLTSEDLW